MPAALLTSIVLLRITSIVLLRVSSIVLLRISLILLVRVALIALLRITLAAAPDLLHRTSAREVTQQRLSVAELLGASNRVVYAQKVGLAIDVFKPIARVWMTAQPLRAAAAPLLLQRPEHVREVVGVIARTGHDLRPEYIRLFFIFPAELQEVRTHAHLA